MMWDRDRWTKCQRRERMVAYTYHATGQLMAESLRFFVRDVRQYP